MKYRIFLFASFLMLLAAAALAASAEDCVECHTDTGGEPPEVTMADVNKSAHEGLDCTDCHDTIDDPAHDELPPANCGSCHDEEKEIYQRHGRGRVGQSEFVPSCADCHGSHDILPISERKSRVHPFRLPETCGSCHEDDALTEEAGIRFKHPVRVYSQSVHGRNYAATCNDCHSEGTAHKILSPGDSSSKINHFNIPRTCGECHKFIEEDYWDGIHGEMTERGEVEAPTCTTCHGEHNILLTRDPRSPVSPHRLAEATCSPCHESAALNEKYELPTGRLQSFQDSYHGLKSQAGDVTVANCASCHGAHRVLPSTNPESSIHPGSLQKTCGGCHPGISETMAQTQIHETTLGHEVGLASLIRKIYIGLIIIIIGGMAIHWLIDFRYQFQKVKEKRQVRRMDADEVVQHFMLAISFTVLVVTGFSLRFHDSWWANILFGWEGGYTFRGVVHRFSGIILLLVSLWHFLYLFGARGRVFFRDMLPRKHDFTQFVQMQMYNLRRSKEHPQFGRFSYVEKAEYWALLWGTVIMGITGLALWFDNYVLNMFPKGLLDVMLVIHYYEAWLAFLAILIWHMYATVFNPKVYPGNPSWLTGHMSEEVFKAEHPAALTASTSAKMRYLRMKDRQSSDDGDDSGGGDTES